MIRTVLVRELHTYSINDSLLAATAISQGITVMASADPDFERVEEIELFRPKDL